MITIKTMQILFCFCILFLTKSEAYSYDDIPDFDFDDYFMSDGIAKPSPKLQKQINNYDEFFVPDRNRFSSREKNFKYEILRILTSTELKHKFLEVLPLLRRLNKSQRIAFTSILLAQLDGIKSVSFNEVKKMFGDDNSKALLLPIVYDMANLIREGVLSSNRVRKRENNSKPNLIRKRIGTYSLQPKEHVKEIDFASPVNFYKSDVLNLEELGPIIRNAHNGSTEFFSNNDNSTEHIMTNLKLNKSPPLNTTTKQQNALTMEQIEHMALSDLNGTVAENFDDIANGTEISAMALTGRRRIKPNQKLRGPFIETCERFTGGVCLYVKNYPVNEIMSSIRRHRYAMEALLAEYKDAELEQIDYLGNPTSDISDLRRRKDDDSNNPSAMCSSIVRYARPQKARSASGEWKFIVNTGEHTQTLRLEKCSQPLEPCNYLTENFESQCTQVFNYHRLLSWDNTRGLHVDIFKVPTCCSCHLISYKESFPPFINSGSNTGRKKNKIPDFDSASSNKNSQYSTISLNDPDNDEDESEEFETDIAYQYGNGFKLLTNNNNKKTNGDSSSLNKNSFNKASSFPETYLTPPTNDQSANFPFNRFSNRRKMSLLKRKQLDQSIAESDMKISQVAFTPSSQVPSLGNSKSIGPKLVNSQKVDRKRINYNYHPIIDFFEEDEDSNKKVGIERKMGKKTLENENNWRPI